MNTTHFKLTLHKYRYFIVVLAVAVFSWIAVDVVIKEKMEDLTNTLLLQVSEQETLLATIAETTARNGADEITEAVVIDCTVDERTQFDSLLSRLDAGLPTSELIKLERLFGRCGSFYAERKAVMVARLEREIEVYEAYLAQLETIAGAEVTKEYNLEGWKALVAEEKNQSELFTELVGQQDTIIQTLLSGKSAQSEEIKSILSEVKQTQERLFVANRQSADLRTELVPL